MISAGSRTVGRIFQSHHSTTNQVAPLFMTSSKIIDFSPISGVKTARQPQALPMKSQLVEQASKVITDIPLLINIVSKRVRQLNQGRPPLIAVQGRMGQADIALREIIEGKVVIDEPEG